MPAWWLALSTLAKELIVIMAIAAILLLVTYVIKKVFKVFCRRFEAQQKPWPKMVLEALVLPLVTYIWLVFVSLVAYQIIKYWYPDEGFWWLDSVNSLIALVTVLWFGLRLVRGAERFFLSKLPLTSERSAKAAEIRALVKLMQIALFVLAALVLLGILEVPLSALLTFGGVSGIAVAVAGKDFLSNLLGGLFIYFDRHFVIGDWVHSPDRNMEGIVEDINMRFITIRRPDKQLLFLPNNLLSNIILVNGSRMTHRYYQLKLTLTYANSAKLGEMINAIRHYISEHPMIDNKQDIVVSIERITSYSIDLIVNCYTRVTDLVPYRKLQDELLTHIQQIADQSNEVIA